jgi:hypothetical protein
MALIFLGGTGAINDSTAFDLTDYQTVKRLHGVIGAAINAWVRDANGQWKTPYKATKGHPMPPGEPLAVEDVDAFLTWVDDGMPEGPAVA